jgi:hypothetical protein
MELNAEKLRILLEHMLHHNKHHSEEIADIAQSAETLAKNEVAALVREAKTLQDQANDKLQGALDLASKEE